MSDCTKTFVYTRTETLTKIQSSWPTDTQFFIHADKLIDAVRRSTEDSRLIVIILDFEQVFQNVLLELIVKKQIVLILLPDDVRHDYQIMHHKLRYISKYQVNDNNALCAIRIYQTESNKFYLDDPNHLQGPFFEQKANDLTRYFISNYRISVGHMLIIPLNTSDDNLVSCREQLIQGCARRYGDQKIIVMTLYDLIPAEQAFGFVPEDQPEAVRVKSDCVVKFIKQISPIRLYLPGNLNYLPNMYSRLLVESEFGYGNYENILKCEQPALFVENERVDDRIRVDLKKSLDAEWKFDRTPIFSAEELLRSDDFHAALRSSINDTEERENLVNNELHKELMNLRIESTKYSTELRGINQSSGEFLSNDGITTIDINDKIQS